MGGAVIVIESKSHWDACLEKAKSENKPCFIDFFAEWCGPCKMIAPLFEQLSNDKKDVAYFLKVDVDNVPAVAEACSITAMPTFKVFVNGVQADELVGASQDKLKALIAKHTA